MRPTGATRSRSTIGCSTTSGGGRSDSSGWTTCWKNSSKPKEDEMTVTTSRKAVVTLPTDTQILITREFDSPKHLVYRAYTEPALVKRWWSEDRGEVTSVDADPRLGGKWRNVMRANDGSEVAFHGEYREIVPNERLVVTDVYEGIPDPESAAALVTITFTEREGRTILTSLMDLPSKDIRDAIISSGMEGGLQESYDHLEEVVRSLR